MNSKHKVSFQRQGARTQCCSMREGWPLSTIVAPKRESKRREGVKLRCDLLPYNRLPACHRSQRLPYLRTIPLCRPPTAAGPSTHLARTDKYLGTSLLSPEACLLINNCRFGGFTEERGAERKISLVILYFTSIVPNVVGRMTAKRKVAGSKLVNDDFPACTY